MAAGRLHHRERSAAACAAVWLVAIASVAACNDLSGASEYGSAAATADGAARPGPSSKDGSSTGPDAPPPGPPPEASVAAPSGLDFGEMPCGAPPAPRTVEIKNLGAKEITFNAGLAQGTIFDVTPKLGVIGVGETAVVSIAAPGISSKGPVGVSSDVLHITTTAAYDVPHALDIRIGVNGSVFTVSPAGPFSYGQVNGTKTEKLLIRNDGNQAGTLSLAFTTNESFTYKLDVTTPAVLEPGAVVQRTVTANPPNNNTNKDGTLTFTSSSQLCGTVPPPIVFKCHGKDND